MTYIGDKVKIKTAQLNDAIKVITGGEDPYMNDVHAVTIDEMITEIIINDVARQALWEANIPYSPQ